MRASLPVRIADAIDLWLARWLTPARLQRISRSWLGRPIARRSARDVFDIVAGFTHSQVLLACTRLGLLERLLSAPASAGQLAATSDLDPGRMTLLCDAAVAIGLLRRRGDGRYTTTIAGRAIQGDPGILAMIEHNQLLYRDLVDPVALLRGRRTAAGEHASRVEADAPGPAGGAALAGFWPYDGDGERADLDAEAARRYSELMAASQSFIAHEVLDAVDFSQHRRLMDVGGGLGAFVSAVAAAEPQLHFVIVDLPPVAELARRRLAATSLAARIECVGADFFADGLPSGCDVASLVRVLHDHDDEDALALLRSVRAALPSGGVLVVAEPMRGEPSAERIGDVYFPLYFLAMGRGRARTRAEIEAMCLRAGFERCSHPVTHVPLQTSVVVAHG